MKTNELAELLRKYKIEYEEHLKEDVFEEWEDDPIDKECLDENLDVIEEFIECIEYGVIHI